MAVTGFPRIPRIFIPALVVAVVGCSALHGQTMPDRGDAALAESGDPASPVRRTSRYAARVKRLDPHEATDAALEGPLARTLSVEFQETPLRDAVAQLADTLGIQIRIDLKALEEAGVDRENPLTVALADAPARAILRAALHPLDLTAIPRDGALVVTTREAAKNDLAIWFYPLPGGLDASDVDTLVRRLVVPAAGERFGGDATIVPVSGDSPAGLGVTILAPDAVHERILALLAGLDEAAWHPDAAGPAPRHVRVHAIPDEHVREALCGRLVELCNESLADAADPEAEVTEVGTTLVVRSTSPGFHARAANLIATIVARSRSPDDESARGVAR